MEKLRKRIDPFNPTPKGTPVYGSASQLALLDLLQTYDVLPSSYIRAKLGRSYATYLMTLLNREGHIRVPKSAKERQDARYKEALWEITDKGKKLLGTRWQRVTRDTDHFKHKYLRSVIQFSFDRAPEEIPGLRIVTETDVLANAKCPPATRAEPKPSEITLSSGLRIEPDAPLFGLSLSGNYIFFHGFEADRATEQLQTKHGRQSIEGKIKNYADYLERGIYRSRYGFRHAPTILFITVNAERMKNMLDLVEKNCTPVVAKRFAFKVLPDITTGDIPPPTAHMVTAPWARVDGVFNIIETLKGT